MSTTTVRSNSGLAPKRWSDSLFAMVGLQPTPLNSLAGPAPTFAKTEQILRKQSTTDMPVVRIRDLAQSAGDTVRIDCANIIKMRAVMGDENAEGRGAKLDFSYDDIKIDMATLPVSAGGKMTQKRMQHDLRRIALSQLKGSIPGFLWNRALVHMAGGRGMQDGLDWVLPLSTDPDFVAQMVNPVKAPTYNRHYVVSGNSLIQGGQELANIDSADKLLLNHVDQLSALLGEQMVKMMPIRIPGDAAAGDDPIKGVLMLDSMAWDAIVTDTTAGANIRTWQAAAATRASNAGLSKHPLFMASPFLWNGILVRRMGDFGVRWWGAADTKYIAAADRYTGTETVLTLPNVAGFQVSRSLFLGAQALGMAEGVNTGSGNSYTMLENSTNYGRNHEMAGEIMGAEQKIRFALPDGLGNYEPTDIGVLVIDSMTRRLSA